MRVNCLLKRFKTCQVEIHQYALNFVILLCIIPDNFICHRESAATQRVSLLLGPTVFI